MADRSVATDLDLPKLIIDPVSSVQGAALSGLRELVQHKTSGNALRVQHKLKKVL